MRLTDIAVRKAPVRDKTYKLTTGEKCAILEFPIGRFETRTATRAAVGLPGARWDNA